MVDPKTNASTWSAFLDKEERFGDEVFPKVSVIVPTFNCAQTIDDTMQSVLSQDYPDFELLVIDGGSTDITLEVVQGYRDKRIRVFSVGTNRRYEMINIGLLQAEGLYVNILFPGDFYLYYRTLRVMMELALDHHKPHLVYCGAVLRETGTNVKILFRPLTLDLLTLGRQPTSLQSCWIRLDTFQEIGKFPPEYKLRGGFDLLCRFCLKGNLSAFSLRRALTDYDLRGITRRMVVRHFWETFKSIYRYFGWQATVRWLFTQKDIGRFLSLWRHRLLLALRGPE